MTNQLSNQWSDKMMLEFAISADQMSEAQTIIDICHAQKISNNNPFTLSSVSALTWVYKLTLWSNND